MGNKEYLPIGTIVLLKGGEKKVMITGFCVIPNDNNHKLYDYSGCLFPEGIIDSNEVCLFNHNQIEKIYFRGYENEEEKEFKDKLRETIKDIKIDEDNNIIEKNLSDDIEYLNDQFYNTDIFNMNEE